MTTGYSGTPLHRKLGIKEGQTVGIIGAPPGFGDTLGDLPAGVELDESFQPADIFIVFSAAHDEIEMLYQQAMAQIPSDGAIWVAWPKKSSGVGTDLTENTMRELFLPTGMVDNKVCAIDEIWSV